MARVSLDAEPSISVLSPEENTYNVQLMRIMNWYSAEKAKADARKYMREYVKAKMPSELNTFDQVKDVNIVNTYGWISRIVMRNGKISDKHLTKLTGYLKETLDSTIYIPEPVQQKVVISAPKPSIQDAMKEKISEYLGELEGSFDSVVKNKEDFSLYKNMQANQIPTPYVNDIKEWCKNKLREYILVYEGKDSQLVEGYSNITKRELKSIVKMTSSVYVIFNVSNSSTIWSFFVAFSIIALKSQFRLRIEKSFIMISFTLASSQSYNSKAWSNCIRYNCSCSSGVSINL